MALAVLSVPQLHSPVHQAQSTARQRLLDIGSTLLSYFDNVSVDFDPFQLAQPSDSAPSPPKEPELNRNIPQAIQQLHILCNRKYGSAANDILTYTYDEDAPGAKRCTLTITLPSGAVRTYSTGPDFARKNEAKTRAASIAVSRGALNFIHHGTDAPSRVLAPVNPLSASVQNPMPSLADTPPEPPEEPSIQEIEGACDAVSHAEEITPQWINTRNKAGTLHGCALVITLGPNHYRTYSAPATFPNFKAAKVAAAKVALSNDVVHFIESGPLLSGDSDAVSLETPVASDSDSPKTLQEFFDQLPKPLPAPVDITAVGGNFHPSQWIVRTFAPGLGLTASYDWSHNPKTNLHGCVLGVTMAKTNASVSYSVPPVFSKRQDARVAAILEACAQGLEAWVSSKLPTNELKALTAEQRAIGRKYIDDIATAMVRVRTSLGSGANNLQPQYDITKKAQTEHYTGRLVVSLSKKQKRIIKSSDVYDTSEDCKLALAVQALDEGVLEWLRFRGEPAPADYDRDSFRFPPTADLPSKPRPFGPQPRNPGILSSRTISHSLAHSDATLGAKGNTHAHFDGMIRSGDHPLPAKPLHWPPSASASDAPAYDAYAGGRGSARWGEPSLPVLVPRPRGDGYRHERDPLPYYPPPPPSGYDTREDRERSARRYHDRDYAPTPLPEYYDDRARSGSGSHMYSRDYDARDWERREEGYWERDQGGRYPSYDRYERDERYRTRGELEEGEEMEGDERARYEYDRETQYSSDRKGKKRAASPLPVPSTAKKSRTVDAPTNDILPHVVESAAPKTKQSYTDELYSHCHKYRKPKPIFSSNAVKVGEKVEHEVWLVLGKDRLELQKTFPSITEGREALSRRVLRKLKAEEGA